jgi:elongation factor P
MAKINGNEIRPGNVIEHDGGLWVAVRTNAVKPGKGGAYNQVELKNLINGTKLNERFRSAETVEKVRLEQKDFSFLYAQGTRWCSWTPKAASAPPSCKTA